MNQLRKMIFLSFLMILVSLNSFALTAKDAKKITKQSIINININRIKVSANSGYCVSDAYSILLDDEIAQYFIKLGFIVDFNYKKDGVNISWCD